MSTEDYRLRLPESAALALDIVEVRVREALDDLFTIDVFVHTEQVDRAVDEWLGRRALLTMPSLSGTSEVNAVIANVRQELAETTGVSRYRLRLVAPLWLTTQRTNSRIFQEQSIEDIVNTLVDDYGVRVPPCSTKPTRDGSPHEYIAQYGETDWDFLRRVLADEGIAAWAQHDGSGAVVLSDDMSGAAHMVAKPVPFVPPSDLRPEGPHVWSAELESAITPAASHVRDYDYKRPHLPLDGRALDADAVTSEGALEKFEFGIGAFRDEASGAAVATRRLEEARARRQTATFRSNVPIPVGTVFTLAGHPRTDANIRWLVVHSRTDATHDTAHHEVLAIPAAQPHRPVRRPHPRVLGTQTAVVVGPDTEEIDVDAEGRVCVRFRWDRRDKAADTTRRVRVSQGWAGPGYGFVCVPRIGDEVVVDFLDGDPDQPLIVGRVHNGVNRAPQKWPDQKACSTWRSLSTPGGQGFNEITLDDAAGQERLYVHASRDAIVEVENDVHAHVKGHVYGLVRGNGTGGVKGTGSLSIDGDAKLEVGGNLGVHVAGDINATATNIVLSASDQRHDESTNHFIKTGGLYVNAKSVAQFNTAHFHVFAGDIRLQAGGSVIELTSGGIRIDSDGPVKVNGSVIELN